MSLKQFPSRLLALGLAISSLAAPAWAGSYVYTSIVPASVGQPMLGGMNANDQVVGAYVDPVSYAQRGYVWSAGKFTPVDHGPYGTWLTDINDSGLASGYYYASASDQRDFKYTAFTYDTVTGVAQDLPVAARWSAAAVRINASGATVGTVFPKGAKAVAIQALLASAAGAQTLVGPYTPYKTLGVAINDSGDAVFSGVTPNNSLIGYVYRQGTFSLLRPPPGGVSVNGWGCGSAGGFITNDGLIGGSYGTSQGVSGFTLKDGVYTTYAFPGNPAQNTLTGITQQGAVAGCFLQGNKFHGFIATTAGNYYQIDYPGAANTYLSAVNANGDLAGEFNFSGGTGNFIAQCPKDQAPCTQ
jgi:hypothetical protein